MYLQSKTQGRLRCQKRRSLPQPVKKPQNHFHEYRQKVTATMLFQTASHPVFQLLAQTAHVCFHEQKRVHTHLRQQDRTQRLTRRNRGRFGWGVVSLLSERSARSPTSPGRVSERKVLPLLGLGRGCSQRTQRAFGTATCLCVSLFRGVAAPLGCVIFFRFCRNYGFHTLCSGLSACARHGRYHYPRCALRAVETPDGRLLKWLICCFFAVR